ncbi:hypothetical protein AWZ03_014878, partial [Drosophila navojoa]
MMAHDAGSGVGFQRVCYPLFVKDERIVATVLIGGRRMTATIDTGATHSFISEDCVRRQTIRGDFQDVQSQIRLANGSALSITKMMKVEVGLAGKVVWTTMLVMPSMMYHLILGMDFLCAMGTTLRCGDAELIMRIEEKPLPHAQGVSMETSRSGGQDLLARPGSLVDGQGTPNEGASSDWAKKVDHNTPKGELKDPPDVKAMGLKIKAEPIESPSMQGALDTEDRGRPTSPEGLWTRRGDDRAAQYEATPSRGSREAEPTPQRRVDASPRRGHRDDSLRVAVRYTPGAVGSRRWNTDLIPRSEHSAERVQVVGSRRRALPSAVGGPDPGEPANRKMRMDYAGPSPARTRQRTPNVPRAGFQEPTRHGRQATDASPPKSPSSGADLMVDMTDVLDGWDSDMADWFGREYVAEREMPPLVPYNWKVRPAGTVLSADAIRLLRREVDACDRRHRRTRFRMSADGAVFNITVAATGAVVVSRL